MTPAQWLTERLGGDWRGGFGTARCPAHEDKRPSLSIRDGDDAPLLKCHAGCSSGAVVDALKRGGIWPVPSQLRTGRNSHVADTSACALEIWREARPIAATIAEVYLRSRGVVAPLPPSLRYHRSLRHKRTGLILPALVAGVSGADRHVIAIQRTFLKLDGSGKATVSDAKMSLGAMGRGAVRLAPAAEALGIAEGIETALSAAQIFALPVWASLGAERLGRIELPSEVRHVIIFGDIGSEAPAYKARDEYRRQGRKAEVRFPTTGKDFNDQLCPRRAA
jgi:putative DNA primase/helicase